MTGRASGHELPDPELDQLESLTMLADPRSGFERLTALLEAVRTETGVKDATPAREVATLRYLLSTIVATARASLAVENFDQLRSRRLRGREDTFLAAAGEQLRLVDQSSDPLVAIVGKMLDSDRSKLESTIARLDQQGARNTRTAIWLGSTVPRTGARNTRKCLRVLRDSAYRWLGNDKVQAGLRQRMVAAGSSVSLMEIDSSEDRVTDHARKSIIDNTYVARRDLEHDLRAVADDGVPGIIIVAGKPGSGKTTLVRHVVSELNGSVVIVRCVDGRLHLPDLGASLERCGIESKSLSYENSQQYLALMLNSNSAPNFAVLDNFDTADELFLLLPEQTRSKIIATCRKHGGSPGVARILVVDDMTQEESRLLIRNRLPGLNDDELNELMSATACYPLLIVYACALIAETDVPISRLCGDITSSPGNAPTSGGHSLSRVLFRIIAIIRQQNRVAWLLLALAAMRPLFQFTTKTAQNIVRGLLNNKAAAIAYADALRLLKAYSLVEVIPNYVKLHERNVLIEKLQPERPDIAQFLESAWCIDDCMIIHPLTKNIFKEHFRLNLDELLTILFETLSDFLKRCNEMTPDSSPSMEESSAMSAILHTYGELWLDVAGNHLLVAELNQSDPRIVLPWWRAHPDGPTFRRAFQIIAPDVDEEMIGHGADWQT